MAKYEDGEWWVAGFILNGSGKRSFALIEQIDKVKEDPAARMNYWREQKTAGEDSPFATLVQVIEVHVSNVKPRGFETTDHRMILTEGESEFAWECRCGQASGQVAFGEFARYSAPEASVAAARHHDQHLVHVAPNLRCARCGERSHTIEYCPRLP